MAIGSTLSVCMIGLKAFIVQVRLLISPGLPYFSIIGLPDASLSEARERVKSACQATGFGWPQTRVTVNMSPAAMPKRGSSHDLAIAASVLCAAGAIGHDCLEDTIVLGEVNLDGSVLPIHGLLPIMLHAEERGVRKMIVPHRNLDEASMVDGLDVVGVRHVGELIELMGGDDPPRRFPIHRLPTRPPRSIAHKSSQTYCWRYERGSGSRAWHKWALEVAAAAPGINSHHDRPARQRQNHAGLTYARHHVSVERGGTTGSGIDSIAVRHTASVRHHRHAAVRGHRTTPPARRPWWVVAAASPFPAQSRARASRHSVSGRGTGIQAHAPCRRCANHWNPGMWRFPVQKAAPITRPHSNSSWRPTPVRADTITAPANVALAGKKTVCVISL